MSKSLFNSFFLASLAIAGSSLTTKAEQGVSEGPYQADWQSISAHQTPEWLADDKFGIFIHWMPNAVPAYNDEWYARWMYTENHDVFNHHKKTWGDQKEFGYIDFIPKFKCEKWDPVEWASFFKEVGAKFVVPTAEHHDHYAMWDSALTKWDAKDTGPKRDLIGELAQATREAGLRFGVSNHRARGWNFFTYDEKFDTMDPEHKDFYWPQLGKEPDAEWLADWQARLHELVDKYQPDVMWFDYGWNGLAFEPYKKDYAAYYYNQAAKWGKEVSLIYKGDHLPKGAGLLDVEKGKLDKLWPSLWMTDTTVFKRTWGYVEGAPMKEVNTLLHDLIDIVSKNGTLLLNVGPKADGTIPQDQREVLLEMGKWLKVNGDSIYKTRPFITFKEGEHVRYTRRGNSIYAIFLEAPKGEITLKELSSSKLGGLTHKKVSFLDGGKEISWKQDEKGLHLNFPEELPGTRAWVAKVELEGIGFDKPVVRIEHKAKGAAVFAHSKVHNFTEEVQSFDVSLFNNGKRLPAQTCRVKLEPGESTDVRFEDRDQNHYNASHCLLLDLESSINEITIGNKKPASSARIIAYPSIPMSGPWKYNEGDQIEWSKADFDHTAWKTAQVPAEWPLGRKVTTAWFRKEIFIPEEWEGRELVINLGVVRDTNVTYINGQKVGESDQASGEYHFSYEVREFDIPTSALKFGETNVIAVRIQNFQNGGGMTGPAGFVGVKN